MVDPAKIFFARHSYGTEKPPKGRCVDMKVVVSGERMYLHSEIQGRLTTKCQHDSIWPLFLNDVCDVLGCHGKVVYLVCELMICLYGGNVGVDKD